MSWVARNRWYLVALSVVAPAAVLVALSTGWFDYMESESGRPQFVRPDVAVEYSGATWTLTTAGSIAADAEAAEGLGLLPGTSLVIVELEVIPGATPPQCTLELVDASGTRRWQTETHDVDVEADADAETRCSTSAEGPYTLQSWFVVPDDAVADSTLRLSDPGALPDLLVFDL